MKQIFAWVLVMITFVGVGGCKSKQEAAIADSISYMKKITSVLQSVKDEASAKAAVPKLEAIAKDMKSLKEEISKMSELPKEEMEKLQKKYADEGEKASKEMMKEMERIEKDPKLAPIVDNVMKALFS